MLIHLDGLLPTRTGAADAEVHLEGGRGWAVAPCWNGAVHEVQILDHRQDGTLQRWSLAIDLHPDAWHPAAPISVRCEVELRAGRGGWHGTVIEQPRGGGARMLPVASAGRGRLSLTCQQYLEDGRRDFRDLRCEMEVDGARLGPGRAVTLHEAWTVPASLDLRSAAWQDRRIDAICLVGSRTLPVTITAERRGLLLRGRWREDGGRQGDVWGTWAPEPAPRSRRFTDAGMVVGLDDIAAARRRIASGTHDRAWRLLAEHGDAYRAHEPRPHVRPHFVHWSEPGPVRDLKADCEAAWGNTLLHALGHGEAHSAAAARIIAAWPDTCLGIADTGGHLAFSYCLPAMIWAAHLLRALDQLTGASAERFAAWLAAVARPIACTELHGNNWRAWAIHLDVCIAVYCRRGDWFDLALARYRDLLARYTHDPSGITSETGRDLVHAQMGLAPMLATCELAWRNGIDLYAEREHRLLAAVELHGPFAMGRLEDWPLAQPARDVGKVWPMYELAARHWRGRLGMPMPRTMSVLAANRPEPFDRIGWGTLLHPWEDET